MMKLVKAEEYRLMRILQVVHQYMPEYMGGTELHTRWLAEGLSQAGHSVGVFYRISAPKTELTHRVDDHDIQVWTASVGEVTPAKRFLTTFGHSALLKFFRQTLAEMKPDIVHIQHLMGLPVSIVHFLQREGIPYIITLHDYWWVCANAQLLTNYDQTICEGPGQGYLNCAKCVLARGEKSGFYVAFPLIMGALNRRNKLLRDILNEASAIITPSHFVSNWYRAKKAFRQEPNTIPHAMPLPDTLPNRDTSKRDGIRFGYIGGLSPQKGVHIAIEAFNGLDGGAELWIVGDERADPDYAARLRALADERVLFLGKLSRAEVWQTLAQIDMLLVPSIWYETFAFVVSEAFAMGVPVIVSDIGALSERVADGVTGRLVSPGDVAAWRRAMRQLCEISDELRKPKHSIKDIKQYIIDIEVIYQTNL